LHTADDNNKVKKREEERECINNKYGKPRLGLGGLQEEEEGIE
jgi:hypothetical protein